MLMVDFPYREKIKLYGEKLTYRNGTLQSEVPKNARSGKPYTFLIFKLKTKIFKF
jgi:hypothetical protein